MRKLIVEEWISLDGYVTDRQDQLNFFTDFTPEENRYSDNDQLKFLEQIDTILLGRKTYELFVDFWPTATTDTEAIADKLNELPKMVFSNTLSTAPWGRFTDADILNGEATEAVTRLKLQPGKNMVLWGSISVAQSLMKAGLVDEYHVQLCPVLTGGGRRLFNNETDMLKLRLKETRQYKTGVIFLNYEIMQ